MIAEIVQVGTPVLRMRAAELTREQLLSPPVQELIEVMRDTMRSAPGVGLAAPQIGVGLQIAVIEDLADYLAEIPAEELELRGRRPVPYHVIVNPVITLGEQKRTFFEGCLSLEGFSGVVERALSVKVECWDEHGEPKVIEAEGWYARILQHEIDHLFGTLYIDRMNTRTFTSVKNLQRYGRRQS